MKEKKNNRICNFGKKYICKRSYSYDSVRIQTELAGIYPGINVEGKVKEYHQKKRKAVYRMLGLGLVIIILCVMEFGYSGEIENGYLLEREKPGGGEKEFLLDVTIGDTDLKDIPVLIEEKRLSEEEIQNYLIEIKERLPERILGQNNSLNYVTKELDLITEWESTGITIWWSSNNPRIIQEDGTLGKDGISKQGTSVMLTAEIVYEEVLTVEKIEIIVFPAPKEGEEELEEKILTLIKEEDKRTLTDNYFELPDMLNGMPIVWKEKRGQKMMVVLGFVIVSVFAVLWGMDEDVHKKYKERNRQLLMEYTEFVCKLQLMVSAGMSVRNAFSFMVTDYQKKKNKGGKKRIVYEELTIVVRKLESGMSEQEAYDYFGKRCNLWKYKKLVAIIISNQKKGSEGLSESLLSETRSAFEERKAEARRLGEEAGTKLLVPMMMMMGIVMMIIVIPAYFSFGGI